MKYLYALFFTTILLISCNKNDDSPSAKKQDEVEFTGTWKRQFEVGPSNLHKVSYKIYQDSIRYKLVGPIGNSNYKMIRDSFTKTDNRFIGHNLKNNKYYVVFVKDITSKNLTLYKKEVTDVNKGKLADVPASDNTQSHGWNIYSK